MIPFGASLHSYDAKKVSREVSESVLRHEEAPWYVGDRTQQHLKEDADINTIMRRFGVTGQIPAFAPGNGMYGDFTGIQDYEDAVMRIEAAQEAFMRLPPEVREKFSNNPGELVKFAATASEEDFVAAVTVPEAPSGSGTGTPS